MLKANAVPSAQVLSSLPIFPLPNVVLLPGMVLPLNVFEPRYLDLVDFVRAHGQHIGVPLLRPQLDDDPGPPPFEAVFGVGKLVFHVPLADGRRIIRLEGVCRVRTQRELPPAHRFREVDVTALGEPQPRDSAAITALRDQVEHIAHRCGDERESLASLLGINDVRVFLYALTAFLPSLELMAADDDDFSDRRALVELQQRSLAAETADDRVQFLSERTRGVLARMVARRDAHLLN